MIIRDTMFSCSAEEVLDELQRQMIINGYPYLQKGYKRSGNSLQVQCPYHGGGQENHPSYGIRMSDGMGHCFACGEIHDLPDFITACFQQNDPLGKFGWQWLKKNFLSLEVEERKDVVLDFNRDRNNSTNSMDILDYVSEEELDSYRYIHSYMYERRLTDEIIELFDIGYDKKTRCITFPVRDIRGNCLFIARRSVDTKYFNYPRDVEKPLYGLYELQGVDIKENEIIICESMLDALTCWVYGKYAVALNGVESELQIKQLRQLPCRQYILATDNDKAGQRARKRIASKVKNKILMEYEFPQDKKDINELTLEEFENLSTNFLI